MQTSIHWKILCCKFTHFHLAKWWLGIHLYFIIWILSMFERASGIVVWMFVWKLRKVKLSKATFFISAHRASQLPLSRDWGLKVTFQSISLKSHHNLHYWEWSLSFLYNSFIMLIIFSGQTFLKGSVTLLTVLFVPTSLISSSVTKPALEIEKVNNCRPPDMIHCIHWSL